MAQKPKKDTEQSFREIYKEVSPFLGLGIQLAVTMFLMVLLGNWLDEKYHLQPLFLSLCSVFGVIAGMYHLLKIVKDLESKK